jgi:hypothetical protein
LIFEFLRWLFVIFQVSLFICSFSFSQQIFLISFLICSSILSLGHGALVCALNNPGRYRSVSCFAPITNPSVVPWGLKAFPKYLGEDKETWKKYDGCELARAYAGPRVSILVDQVCLRLHAWCFDFIVAYS